MTIALHQRIARRGDAKLGSGWASQASLRSKANIDFKGSTAPRKEGTVMIRTALAAGLFCAAILGCGGSV
ncbi:MAG TPA: hypothetical protein VK459_09710, partial [Polyangiaceae bacterium]|nr:hypothetical protein [Polyangiaceae bacterium]